jgi:two-component system, NtrC family, response regulator HydG
MQILVVDDELSNRRTLEVLLKRAGYTVASASNGQEALVRLKKSNFSVVITDLRMPQMDGMTLLTHIKEQYPMLQVIMATAFGSIDTAVEAMKLGAWDFITKPIKKAELLQRLEKIAERDQLQQENQQLRAEIARIRPNWIGQSLAMERVSEEAQSVADTEASVFLVGSSGTGKSLLARWIHNASHRNNGKFVVLNCGAIPESLMESELFGHEKGSFTGAQHTKLGRLEQANGGTLFLDEVTEMALQLQVKLLRVLQDGEFERVGGTETRRTNMRVIAASNRNLEQAILEGKLRSDLYYRLNVVQIEMPELKKRREDIPLLVEDFLIVQANKNNRPIKPISDAALQSLMQWDWPGNVRELENTIERAIVLSKSDIIDLPDLPKHLQKVSPSDNTMYFPIGTSLEEIERHFILATLASVEGDKNKAASLLGITVRTLYRKEAEWREAGWIS